MSEKVPHIQSASSETSAVHRQDRDGFPPHKGKRAAEYKVVEKPLTCNHCIEIEEALATSSREIPDTLKKGNNTSESVTYKVTFDKLDSETNQILQQIVFDGVLAEDPLHAVEVAVEEHLRATVVQEKTFIFNPGE